jgi:glycine betaine catabolism B
MANAYGSRLVEKMPRVADIASFRFERPEAYRFQAGQWFVITFPGQDPEKPWEHHFSHSDSPTEPWLEFTTRLRGSDFKNALDALPPGAQVQIEGPYGAFTMPPDVERAAFLAGGIGITCARSILRWVCDTCTPAATKVEGTVGPADRSEIALRDIILFFANRSEDAIPFADELTGFTESIPGFRMVHVLSRPGEAWRGYRGHLDRSILEVELADFREWHFFVSGPPSFDLAMQDVLVKWGVDAGRIKMERFEGY